MSMKRINEAFKRLYEDAQPVATSDDDLRTALMDEVYRLMAKGGYIKEFEIAFQDVIERFYPDKAWWEVCDVNIFEHLFTARDPEATVDAIVASIESKEAPQESLTESPEIKECPVCARKFAENELEDSRCPKCGEQLIKADSGEYVKYEECLSEDVHKTFSEMKSWIEKSNPSAREFAYDGPFTEYVDDIYNSAVEAVSEAEGEQFEIEPSIQNGIGGVRIYGFGGYYDWDFEEECDDLLEIASESNTEEEFKSGVQNYISTKVDWLRDSGTFEDDDAEYYDESLKESTYKDCGGIMGEPGAQYTDADLKAYWDDNNDIDPVLNAYKGNYDAWLKDTIGNMDRVNEAIMKRLESYVANLNEAEMSDEDRHDSDLIRSMIQKMQVRSNAAFTPEEKAVMAKYGITRNNWQKKLTVADRELNPDLDGRSRDFYHRSYSNGTPSKINYADRARKLPARKQNQIAGDGSSTFLQNANYNAHGIGRNIQDVERNIRNDQMQEPLRNMRDALRDRRYAQQQIDNADASRAKRMAAAQAEYDKAKRNADWWYEQDTVHSADSRDRAQSRIDTLLRRKK